MIGQVQTKNGNKQVIPLAGSIPVGNPVGTLLFTYKKLRPRNYLYCDGSTFNENIYPALYLYLGSNKLPDYRECGFVGAERNTTNVFDSTEIDPSTSQEGTQNHDVYGQGEFKDDQIQNITGEWEYHDASNNTRYHAMSINDVNSGAFYHTNEGTNAKSIAPSSGSYNGGNLKFDASRVVRAGNTTHGKRKAVYVYIKAVDGVDIADEDAFLDTVKDFVEDKMFEFNDAPLGSTMSYLGTTDLANGKWLICDGRDTTGTDKELSTYYPSLYTFLGNTNVLPYIVDRNSPLDYTRMISRNVGGSSTDTWTATDSGLVIASFVGFNGGYGYLSVNDIIVTRATTPNNQVAAQSGAGSVFVEKGDVIKVRNDYHTVANTWSFIPFSKYKIIKATSSSDSYHVPNQEVVQIEQYFDEGLQRTQSYSTTETLTGGKWIDGKPIYRKMVEGNNASGTGWQTLLTSGFENVDTMVKIYGILYTSDSYIINLPYGETNYSIELRYNINDHKIYVQQPSTAFNNRPYKLVFEYTKTTE